MTPTTPLARRRASLSASLGLGEKLFASTAEKRFARSIEDGLELVEKGLVDAVAFPGDIADVSTHYLLDAGGKRIRPTLTLLTAQLGTGNSADVVTAAETVEITHLASLYHDDVMDEAQMRRGVPSAQTVWGNSVAILTGDLLFARASLLIAGLGEEAAHEYAKTFERLVLGQLHETIGPQGDEDPVAHYIQVLADKTGSLIALAALLGVMFGEASDAYREPVRAFGEKIGVAFQLVDDIIDLSADTDQTGKQAGTDLRAGVPTLPSLYLQARAASSDAGAIDLLARIERAAAAPEGDPEADAAFAALVAELRDHAVVADTFTEARRWADEAVAAIAPLPDGPVKKALSRFADAVLERRG